MRCFIYRAHIQRTPQDVFAFMIDFGDASRWRSLVHRIDIVGGGPLRL
jgi:hypothetical protein